MLASIECVWHKYNHFAHWVYQIFQTRSSREQLPLNLRRLNQESFYDRDTPNWVLRVKEVLQDLLLPLYNAFVNLHLPHRTLACKGNQLFDQKRFQGCVIFSS